MVFASGRVRHMAFAGRILQQHELAGREAPLLAIAGGDLNNSSHAHHELAPRGNVPVFRRAGFQLREQNSLRISQPIHGQPGLHASASRHRLELQPLVRKVRQAVRPRVQANVRQCSTSGPVPAGSGLGGAANNVVEVIPSSNPSHLCSTMTIPFA